MGAVGPFQTLPQLLAQRVKATPDAAAFLTREESGSWQAISWITFYESVQRLASKLWAKGLRPGDQVALLMPNNMSWEIIQHAVYQLGCVLIGLDLNDPAERMDEIFTLCSPTVLFIDQTLRLSQIPPQVRRRLNIIVTGNVTKDALQDSAEPLSYLDSLPNPQEPVTFPVVDPGAIATILFTSGTTGHPKALCYQHRQFMLAISQIIPCFSQLPDQAHTACWLPLANPFQRTVNYCAMAMNWKVFMVPTPAAIMEHVQTIEPHLFAAVPRFYEKLYQGICRGIDQKPKMMRVLAHWAQRTGSAYRKSLSSGQKPPLHQRLAHRVADRLILQKIRRVLGANLRYLLSGSAAMPLHLIEALDALGWTLLEAYGVSENIVPIAMNAPHAVRPGSVGRPLEANLLRIADDGEILVKGTGVAVNAVAVDDDGFLRTGDTGRLDRDGYLWLTGRKSDMFKLSTGRKVIPQTIEEAVTPIEAVEHCITLGNNRKFVVLLLNVPPASWDTLTRKYNGARGAMAYLRERCLGACSHLPQYCRPVDILVIHDPFSPQTGELTANLKLRKKMVTEKYRDAIDRLYQQIETHGRQGNQPERNGRKCDTTS